MKHDERMEELEARLARVRLEDGAPELDARWKTGVMDAVRACARAGASADPTVERIVRRAFLAAAAAAVAAAVVASATGSVDPSLEVARLLVRDPSALLQAALVL